jgi:hypothetical protein
LGRTLSPRAAPSALKCRKQRNSPFGVLAFQLRNRQSSPVSCPDLADHGLPVWRGVYSFSWNLVGGEFCASTSPIIPVQTGPSSNCARRSSPPVCFLGGAKTRRRLVGAFDTLLVSCRTFHFSLAYTYRQLGQVRREGSASPGSIGEGTGHSDRIKSARDGCI